MFSSNLDSIPTIILLTKAGDHIHIMYKTFMYPDEHLQLNIKQ